MFFIKDFNTFTHDHTLHHGRKHSCNYCLHAFVTEEILKRHIKVSFKINGKQTIKMPKKYEYVKFKKFERKIKSLFMIYADVESIFVPGDNGKQNPNESYTNKYQEHIACSFVCNLICAVNKFRKSKMLFKTLLPA